MASKELVATMSRKELIVESDGSKDVSRRLRSELVLCQIEIRSLQKALQEVSDDV
jgi:hypothetical protein